MLMSILDYRVTQHGKTGVQDLDSSFGILILSGVATRNVAFRSSSMRFACLNQYNEGASITSINRKRAYMANSSVNLGVGRRRLGRIDPRMRILSSLSSASVHFSAIFGSY
jgi:hypothetical protein